mmetsp:Transcript_33716/g.79815  ORF Transcript_33716/g.79815 Transcript_33716/m.79815 type:complete len:207 (-) Transcript_33716:832-1452(-)
MRRVSSSRSGLWSSVSCITTSSSGSAPTTPPPSSLSSSLLTSRGADRMPRIQRESPAQDATTCVGVTRAVTRHAPSRRPSARKSASVARYPSCTAIRRSLSVALGGIREAMLRRRCSRANAEACFPLCPSNTPKSEISSFRTVLSSSATSSPVVSTISSAAPPELSGSPELTDSPGLSDFSELSDSPELSDDGSPQLSNTAQLSSM